MASEPVAGAGERLVIEGSRSFRLLAHHEGRFHRIARFKWTARDSSLYIFPTIPLRGVAFAGAFIDVPPNASTDLDFSKQIRGSSAVKLSLHETGQTHAECDGGRSAAVFGAPLFGAAAHVASIDCFNLSLLPSLDVAPSIGRDLDLVVQLPAGSAGIHVGVHTRPSSEPVIPGDEFKTVVTMVRSTLEQPLQLGFDISARAVPPLATEPTVIVLGGWGTDARPDAPISMAYAVTQGTS